MNNWRSLFSLSKLEVAVGVGTGIATWLIFRALLWGTEPFSDCCGFFEGRQELFTLYAPVFSTIAALSVVFVVHASNEATHLITPLGNFAIASSSLGSLTLTMALPLFPWCFACFAPFTWGLAMLAVGQAVKNKSHWGNLLVLPVNVAWFFLWWSYWNQWWAIYGD